MQAKAVLVLGSGISATGELGDIARESVRGGQKAFEGGQASWLIMSGGFSYKADFIPLVSEAQAMKDYAVSLGTEPGKILVESESRNTLGNAYFSKVNFWSR